MRGRRRDPRFALTVPWEGALRLPGDVTIERRSDSEVWVVSSAPAHRGERLTLEVMGAGPPEILEVRVVDSTPVLVDGVIRHGLRLTIVRDAQRNPDGSAGAVDGGSGQ
jgi:hypothetical protein